MECSDKILPGKMEQIPCMESQINAAWRLHSLDVLRGLAITWIILFHMIFLTIPNMAPPQFLDKLLKTGGMGVQLFFVVSAFSLCLSSDRRQNEESWIFYLRRIFRIVPLFYLILIMTLLRDKLVFGLSHSYSEIVVNALFLYNFVGGWQVGIVMASWVIGVIMVFYFLYPYIYRKCSNTLESIYRTMLLCTLCVIAYSVISSFDGGINFWQWSFFRHLPSFLVGILCYSVFKNMRENNQKVSNYILGRVTLSVALFLGIALLYSDQQFLLISTLYWQSIIFALLVLGSSLGVARAFFSLPVLCWIGKISYSTYLVHPLVIVALQPIYKIIAAKISGSLSFLLCASLTLICVYFISYLLWRIIEKPGINMGERVIARLRRLQNLAP